MKLGIVLILAGVLLGSPAAWADQDPPLTAPDEPTAESTADGKGKAAESPAAPVSFVRDVLPALSRAGCNAGACHGTSKGKDGFRLSLFGFDADGDYYRLTREQTGRLADCRRTMKGEIVHLMSPVTTRPDAVVHA